MEGSERSEAILALLRKIVEAEIDGVLLYEETDGQFRAVTADVVLAALENKLARLNLQKLRGTTMEPLSNTKLRKTKVSRRPSGLRDVSREYQDLR